MAISKKERVRLERILDTLTRGALYLKRPDVFVCGKALHGGAMAFSRRVTAGQVEHVLSPRDPLCYEGDQHLVALNKECGSELQLVFTARRLLEEMLRPEEQVG